jgi:hypothetical protein
MLGGERRDQPRVGAEIAWLPDQLRRQQPTGRRRESGLAGETGLDLVAERPLQRDGGQRRAQPGRSRHALDLQAEGTLHDGGAQTVLRGQRLDALGRLALQAKRPGDQPLVAQFVPQPRQMSLQSQELRCAIDAALTGLDPSRPLADKPSRRQTFERAVEQRAPAPGRQAMRHHRHQIVGQIGPADATHGTRYAHQHDIAQPLGVDRSGCAGRLQHGSLHGHEPPRKISALPTPRRGADG